MSWSPATSRVRRHIEHRGFDAQKQWVISYSPWVALAIVFPETPAQMFDPWRSLSFTGLCQIAGARSPKTDKWCFFFLVTGLKRQQRVHCQAEQESSSVSPDLKPQKKAAGSPYIIHWIINIIMISYCLTDLREDGWTDEWMVGGSKSFIALTNHTWTTINDCKSEALDMELGIILISGIGMKNVSCTCSSRTATMQWGPLQTLAYQCTSGAEGLNIHAPWMQHYLHCCHNSSHSYFINLLRCHASLRAPACTFSSLWKPNSPFWTFSETSCPMMNHEMLTTLPTSQHRSALELVSNIFYSGAAQWQHHCLRWQVGFDVCQGASPSMRGGTWSASKPTHVSVECTRKNNLKECGVSVGLPCRSRVSLSLARQLAWTRDWDVNNNVEC